MDEKNIDLLIKKRSEEIRKEREENPIQTQEESNQKIGAKETACVSQRDIDETLNTLNRVQKRSLLWKVLVLILVVALNVLWFKNISLQKDLEAVQAEKLNLLDLSPVHAYNDISLETSDFIVQDQRQWIKADVVIKHIDTSVHYSNSGTRVYVPLASIKFDLESPEVTEYVKSNIVDINIPIMEINEEKYIDFEVLRKLYGLEVMTALDGSFVIYDENYEYLKQVDSHVRFEITRHNMDEYLEGEGTLVDAVVVKEYEDLSKIITKNGRTGYVKSRVVKPRILDYSQEPLNVVREDFKPEEPFHVTWNQVSSYRNNPNIESQEDLPGVSILSPTWFSLNINGIVINESDFRYMRQAHDSGYYVWGLFSNSFNPSWTSDMLNEEVYRKRAIAQILFYTALYDLDGVNIDYENMYLDDKEAFTRFIAELSPLLKSQNVVLSIDVTVPGGSDQYSLVLDRFNLGKHVDYMMLMAYDEHWGSSPISGPVASIPWVEKGLTRTLEEVPSEKLLLGIPLYMRIWIESNGSVTSKAIGIRHLEGVLENQDYQASYDEENGVNYISYESDGKDYRIWVEDEVSLQKRIDFVKTYNLGGIATWSKQFADEETWSFIYDALRD